MTTEAMTTGLLSHPWRAFILHGGSLRLRRPFIVYDATYGGQRLAYTLWAVHDGTVLVRRGDDERRHRPNSAFLTEPGCTVRVDKGSQVSRIVFDLVDRPRYRTNPKRSDWWFSPPEVPPPPLSTVLRAPIPAVLTASHAAAGVEVALEVLARWWRSDHDHLVANERLGLWLARLACDLVQPVSIDRSGEDLLSDFTAVAMKRMGLGLGVTISELARSLGVSRRTLERVSRQVMTSPQAQLDRIRLDAARSLLIGDSDRTVSQVARSVGYRDATAFTRWFRRQCGTSPSAWRRQVQRTTEGR